MKFENKNILITGGSSGIGKALISELFNNGARTIAVIGRDRSKMEPLKTKYPEINFLFLKADVAKLNEIKDVMQLIGKVWDRVDILINNAGVVSAGALEDISDEDIIAQQNINTTGLILLTKHVLPLLKKSEDAAIINISSGLGLIGMPFYATYAATKAAVKQFSEAIRRELKDYPIHVMTVYPTATDTPMMESAASKNMDTPELVAQKTIEGLKNKEIDIILGGEQRIQDNKDNFNDPLKFDEKVNSMYDTMKSRAKNHRSM
ncbi:short-subunit dehydrogenase [Gillisia mitskevichiae]|uniref:Short-subunit dehydrogenase n=1 Tax=Gillisia mitskevichiae TaxID=270921 RepID=A0A495PTH1_9FLAO|nr:SDR family NAD(P)-dependent oxidoreductase [Gillisia mitskevichiae]RKS53045.1 short-subunit dehydrogenase [Gillisia mitskevichiae]